MDLMDYYRDNLSYLRGLSAEFAAEFPKIARRLLISELECQDPYIERLLEGTAFLSARVEKKLDEGYYPFLESVLNSIAPDSLYPVASGAVLEVFPNMSDDHVRKGAVLPAGTMFETRISGINTPCRFSCVENTPLASFALTRAEYMQDVSVLGIKNANAESGLYLRFSSSGGGSIGLANEIRIFMSLPDAEVSLLLRLLLHDVAGVYVQKKGGYELVEGVEFALPLPTGEKLLGPELGTSVRGLRLLRYFLTYPDFFKFCSIKGLGSAGGETQADVAILFKRREQALLGSIKTSLIKLNCVPVLNIFSRRSDRVTIEEKSGIEAYEYHIIPERTAMRDYEAAAVKTIDFFNEKNDLIFNAANFYDVSAEKKEQSYFSVKRRRKQFERRSLARSSYEGTEMFVSFSPIRDDAYQFAADLLVTNRDMPLLLQEGAVFSSPSTLTQRATFMTPPTRPNYPLSEQGNRRDFARLSHILTNLSAMLWQEGSQPLKVLRNMLRSYPVRPPEEMERIVSGIIALDGESDTFQFTMQGTVFYEWGWRLRLILDEDAYAGMGFYLFGGIIAEILKSFTPVNMFLEIHFSTPQSGAIAVWKTSENR